MNSCSLLLFLPLSFLGHKNMLPEVLQEQKSNIFKGLRLLHPLLREKLLNSTFYIKTAGAQSA